MSTSVAWISRSPVKGLRLELLEEADLTPVGVRGDRAFFIVDEALCMISSVRIGSLLAVRARHDEGTGLLTLLFPGGRELAAPVELGESREVRVRSRRIAARPLLGPLSAALTEHAGRELHLFASPGGRPLVDRGLDGAVTLVSTASLERLREVAGSQEPVDHRRFRMTFGIDGLEAHGEDAWVNRTVRLGDAELLVRGHVGRCVLTTRDPDAGTVDFPTLSHLAAYRSAVDSTEPLPFGVHARVTLPGRVSVHAGAALSDRAA